jgi:hypothetical protein
MHIAAAYRKGLGAFHTRRLVLMSPCISVAAKLRIIHSVIRPILEYGMEIWGQLVHLITGTRKQGGSHPPLHLLHFDRLLLSVSTPSLQLANLAGLPGHALLLKCYCLCVKYCPVTCV